LARKAAGGDAGAFTSLVRRHERRVRAFLLRLCRGDSHLADDLAQEAFVKAWRMAASWRGEGSYEGWLLRIAWRAFLSDRRGRRDEVGLEEAFVEGQESDPNAAIDVDRALARLGPRERAAAVLCLGEGWSHKEAARILDLPLGTLKSIVARARTQLIGHLEGASA
jgi:RNA polymerase sigma-70 factor (ECF subfamily)